MDKLQRKVVMSNFLTNKNKKTKTNAKETGFYETLVGKTKTKTKPSPSPKQDGEFCNKIENISDLLDKKYMIPSQFPNITQRVAP